MQRAGRIWMGVLGGLVVAGAAGGTFWWLRSSLPGRALAPEVVVAPAPISAPPTGRPVQEPVTQPPLPTGKNDWTWAPLPTGAIKIEKGSGAVTLTEPGLVRFDVQTGESVTWHWSRALARFGAKPIPGTLWAHVEEASEGESLLFHLSSAVGFHFHGGRLLSMDGQGALFLVNRPDTTTGKSRQALLLTDTQFQTLTERWLPDGIDPGYDWQREPSGWFRYRTRDAQTGVESYHRYSAQTGLFEGAAPPAKPDLWLEQTSLFPGGCGGDGGGNLVKLYKGNQVLWTVLDAVAPMNGRFGGSRVLADKQGALIATSNGPTLIRLADGTLKVAPELKALDSPYLYASPTSAVYVAASPNGQQDGSVLLRATRIGESNPPQVFSLHPTKTDSTVDVTIDSKAYWSEDGRFLQVAVNYPPAGGKCGAGDDLTTFLAPVVAKGDWKAPLQVRPKVMTSLYAVKKEKELREMGPLLRQVGPAEVFTVKGIGGDYKQPLFVVAIPEGEGILLPDPAQLEWVPPGL